MQQIVNNPRSAMMRLTKAVRACVNVDLVFKLWAYGPNRDLQYLIANVFGGRSTLLLASEVIETLDRDRLINLAARYPHEKGDPAANKYLCVGAAIARAAFHAQLLGLEDVRERPAQRLRVLDIGTGAGFFPLVVKHLGHDVDAVDIDDSDLYRNLTELLGIRRTIHRVQIETPLPQLHKRFDLITAFQLLFDRDPRCAGGIWGVEEWRRFVDVMREDYLANNGSLFIGLNSGIDAALLKELDNFFIGLGGVRSENGYHIDFSKDKAEARQQLQF